MGCKILEGFMRNISVQLFRIWASGSGDVQIYIGVAPITQLSMCVIKIVTFKAGHLMW